ncbi:MAG: methylenetetrahydrofolate reductase [NAD(P)H] [Nitrospirae bacterium RBG_16_43_8]|nr:MAG: methylenetetrahydrofolate reductase [NAD(P)H] [Nitrospirae bacterium RBG_16_43_8]
MKIRDVIKEKAAGISFEFFPPKSVEGRQGFMKVVHELKKYDPLYVSVTYGAGGSTQDRTFNTLKWIKEETSLNVMSHLTCIGATRTSMEGLLKSYAENGIDNILALRGDPPKNIPDFDQIKGEFKYAKDLVAFVKGYKSFSIAVAVYLEGHQESPNIEKDIEYTKQKVDAGADFAITQMFFDNSYYYGFMDRALKAGINIPILPGIMPITDFKKVEEFANFCNATMPKEIKKKMETVLDKPEDMRKMGVELAIKQCEDLMRNGVKYLHFYTMNKLETVSEIVEGLGRFHPSL